MRALLALIPILPWILASCGEDLPPALGDRVTDSRLRVIHTAQSGWAVGQELNLSDLRGKPVVLDFWASWCGPCRIQHEYVLELKEEFGDRVTFVGILWEDTAENAREWIDDHGTTYPTVEELEGKLAEQFWLNGLPYFVLLTPDRRLSWDMIGPWARDSVAIRLQAMLRD